MWRRGTPRCASPSRFPSFLSISAFGLGLTAALRRGRCGAPTRGAARGSGTSAGTGCSAAAGGGWRRRSSSASPRWTPFLRPPTPLRRSLGVVGSRHRKSWGGRSALDDGITITVVRVLVAHSAAKYSGVTKNIGRIWSRKAQKNCVLEASAVFRPRVEHPPPLSPLSPMVALLLKDSGRGGRVRQPQSTLVTRKNRNGDLAQVPVEERCRLPSWYERQQRSVEPRAHVSGARRSAAVSRPNSIAPHRSSTGPKGNLCAREACKATKVDGDSP